MLQNKINFINNKFFLHKKLSHIKILLSVQHADMAQVVEQLIRNQ